MTVDGRAAGEQASLEVVRDRTKAWWTAAIAGQLEQSHPVYGTDISASVEDGVLVVKGVVPSDQDRHDVEQEIQQLKGSGVQVLELIPPYVQTHLMGARQANDPNAMPLDEFIAETMNILKSSPEATEICVERVKPLRFAECNGNYDGFFARFNDSVAAAAH